MADRDAIAQWELDQLSGFLSDVEQRRGERLHVQDVSGGFVAELSTATLSTAPHARFEDALRDLAYQAFDRESPGRLIRRRHAEI